MDIFCIFLRKPPQPFTGLFLDILMHDFLPNPPQSYEGLFFQKWWIQILSKICKPLKVDVLLGMYLSLAHDSDLKQVG